MCIRQDYRRGAPLFTSLHRCNHALIAHEPAFHQWPSYDWYSIFSLYHCLLYPVAMIWYYHILNMGTSTPPGGVYHVSYVRAPPLSPFWRVNVTRLRHARAHHQRLACTHNRALLKIEHLFFFFEWERLLTVSMISTFCTARAESGRIACAAFPRAAVRDACVSWKAHDEGKLR